MQAGGLGFSECVSGLCIVGEGGGGFADGFSIDSK